MTTTVGGTNPRIIGRRHRRNARIGRVTAALEELKYAVREGVVLTLTDQDDITYIIKTVDYIDAHEK